jgi:micrococcal nuclease
MRRSFRRRPRPVPLTIILILAVLAVRAWHRSDSLERSGNSPEILAEGIYEVARVVDGDTLVITGSEGIQDQAESLRHNQQVRIRLLSIDTPETVKPGAPIEPWGQEATQFTRQFVAQGSVRLRFDRRRVDQYNRFLAYVYVNDRMLNEELARAGLAKVKVYPGDSSAIGRRLTQAEKEARQAARGIWSGNRPHKP